MTKLTKDYWKTLGLLSIIISKYCVDYALKRGLLDLLKCTIKLMRLPCRLVIKCSIRHQQLFLFQATQMITRSLSSCIDSKSYTTEEARKRDSRSSTAKTTSGWWSQQLWIKGKASRSSETSKTSSNSYLPVPPTRSGSSRNTLKSQCYIEDVSSTCVYGPYSTGEISCSSTRRAIWGPPPTTTVCQIRITTSTWLTTVSRNSETTMASTRTETP